MHRQIIRVRNITLKMIENNPTIIFLFGDNTKRKGLGGLASICRGKSNCIGIATKWHPHMTEDAFFSDDKIGVIKIIIDYDFEKIPKDKDIIIPYRDTYYCSIGTGLAQLDKRAPKVFEYLQQKLKELENINED